MLFSERLQSIGLYPDLYLKLVKNIASKNGYNPDLLTFSDDKKHKLSYNGIKFGANGYNDYIIYSLLHENIAEKKRENYRKRAKEVMLKSGSKYSPASLSYYILW